MKKVKVLGEDYKITNKLPKIDNQEYDTNHIYGLCFGHLKLIWINEKLKGKEMHETMLHEIGHACLRENGIAFTELLDNNLEELIVEGISKGSYSYMVAVVKELLKDKDDSTLRDRLRAFVKGKL